MHRVTLALVIAFFAGCAAIPPPTVKPFADNQAWVLLNDLSYSIGETGTNIVVPAGFVTDFASIPQFLWWWLSPHDYYSKAAIVHDYLYWTQLCTRDQSDNILLIAMQESNVSSEKQYAVYIGVRAGGWSAWDSNTKERSRDQPRVVPQNRLQFPADVTWSDYRKTLISEGIRDPDFGDHAPYCLLGDTAHVPK